MGHQISVNDFLIISVKTLLVAYHSQHENKVLFFNYNKRYENETVWYTVENCGDTVFTSGDINAAVLYYNSI